MYHAYNLPDSLNFINTKFLDTISYGWFSLDTQWFIEYFKTSDYLLQFLFKNKEKIKNLIKDLLIKEKNWKKNQGYEILIQISWKKDEKAYIFDICKNEEKIIFRNDDNQSASQSMTSVFNHSER